MRKLIDAARRAARLILRERALIAGVILSALEAWQQGEVTKATAVPFLLTLVLRQVVAPYGGPGAEVPAGGLGGLDAAAQAALLGQTDNRGPAHPDDATTAGALVLDQTPGSRVDG